jgi:site-specific recombinase XerD
VSDLANAGLLESWGYALHDKRPRTRDFYLREASRFADWLTENGRPSGAAGDLLAVDKGDAEAWLTSLKSCGLTQATIRSRWIALRALYGWAVEVEELDASPFTKVTVAKPDPPIIPVLTSADLRALLKACEGSDFYARRDTALLRLMLATGMRLSEVADIRLDEVDLVNRIIVIHGKGGHDRLVRFDNETRTALDRYKRARARHKSAAEPWLWLGHAGRLTANGIPILIEARARKAGIGHVHPHQLRHTWASRFLAAGGQEGDLQKLGGWQNADIMRRYRSAAAVDRALAAYDRNSPMEGL